MRFSSAFFASFNSFALRFSSFTRAAFCSFKRFSSAFFASFNSFVYAFLPLPERLVLLSVFLQLLLLLILLLYAFLPLPEQLFVLLSVFLQLSFASFNSFALRFSSFTRAAFCSFKRFSSAFFASFNSFALRFSSFTRAASCSFKRFSSAFASFNSFALRFFSSFSERLLVLLSAFLASLIFFVFLSL